MDVVAFAVAVFAVVVVAVVAVVVVSENMESTFNLYVERNNRFWFRSRISV